MKSSETSANIHVSIGIFAWNEEAVIGSFLEALFEQTLFGELAERGLKAQVLCMVNGCVDRTPEIAREVIHRVGLIHPHAAAIEGQVVQLAERGKLNAWNQFVHTCSAPDAPFLMMMDADIRIQTPETLANMIAELEQNPEASVTVDQPVKAFPANQASGWRERLSSGAAQVTQAAPAQLCAQLYCIRSAVARNIYLPRDLAACEDGFIKWVVCTDFLTRKLNPARIRMAPGAAHTFEAYTSPRAVLKNQKRQIIGQTVVHILVDQYLSVLPLTSRRRLSATLRQKDQTDPGWLKRLVQAHVRRVGYFWRLYPDLVWGRFRRLGSLAPGRRLACLPATVASAGVSLISSFLAYRLLKAGSTDYWPKADRAHGSARTPPGIALKPSIGNSQ